MFMNIHTYRMSHKNTYTLTYVLSWLSRWIAQKTQTLSSAQVCQAMFRRSYEAGPPTGTREFQTIALYVCT